MNDKELLDLAAKAAGINDLQWESDGTIQNRMNRPTIPYHNHGLMTGVDWNPLADDADALRLAVKLCMCVTNFTDEVMVGFVLNGNGMNIHEENTDPYAATRRAIVRAAAEIGKDMK